MPSLDWLLNRTFLMWISFGFASLIVALSLPVLKRLLARFGIWSVFVMVILVYALGYLAIFPLLTHLLQAVI
jgi:hypothetical protein